MNHRIKSRIAAVVAGVALVVSPVAYAEKAENRLTKYDTASELLTSLGAMPDFYAKKDGVVTRAEFTAMTVMITGISAAEGKDIFTDVNAGHSYYSEIYAAYSAGIISGDKGGFRPDEPITYYDAAKIASLALGYSNYAQLKGGYPKGYTEAASRAKIMSAGQFSQDGLSVREALVIAYDMLHVSRDELMIDGESILESDMKLSRMTGVVYSAAGESFVEAPEGEETINIEGNSYKFDIKGELENIENYLGCEVEVWLDRDDEIAAIARTKHNGIANVDLNAGEVTLEGNTLNYRIDEGKKTDKFKLSPKAVMGRNGRAANIFAGGNVISGGSMRLTDNDGDGSYDAVMVYSPEYMYISALSIIQKTASDKNGAAALDFSDDNIVRVYLDDGEKLKEIEWESILSGDLAEVYRSDDGKFIKVIIGRKTVSGTADSIDDGEIVIDGVKYDTNSYFESYYSDKVYLGSDITVMISPDMTVAALMGFNSTEIDYGYLVRAYIDEEKDETRAVILCRDNVQRDYVLANTVTVDGYKSKPGDMLVTETLFNIDHNTGARYTNYQLLKYKINSAGQLRVIDTADNSHDQNHITDGEGNYLPLKKLFPELTATNNSLMQMVTKSGIDYSVSGQAAPYFIFGDTLIFSVPAELEKNPFKMYDSDMFSIYSKSLKNEYGYIVDAFDYNSNFEPAAVVIYDPLITGGEPDIYGTAYMVSKVLKTIGADNETTVSIKMYNGENFVEYMVSEERYESLNAAGKIPSKGDIVRISLDSDGFIDGISIDCDYNEENHTIKLGSDSSSNINTSNGYAVGRVYTGTGTSLIIYNPNMSLTYGPSNGVSITSPRSGVYAFKVANAKAIMFDRESNEVRPARFEDITSIKSAGEENASLVAVRYSSGRALTAFVYND